MPTTGIEPAMDESAKGHLTFRAGWEAPGGHDDVPNARGAELADVPSASDSWLRLWWDGFD